jgi:hypothetical protein
MACRFGHQPSESKPTIASLRRDETTRLLRPEWGATAPFTPCASYARQRLRSGCLVSPFFRCFRSTLLPGWLPKSADEPIFRSSDPLYFNIWSRPLDLGPRTPDQPPGNDPNVRPPSPCPSRVQRGFSGSTIRFEQGRVVPSVRAAEALALSGADNPVQSRISFSIGIGYTSIGWTDD